MSWQRQTKKDYVVRGSESAGSVVCTNNNNAAVSSSRGPGFNNYHRSRFSSLADIFDACAFNEKDGLTPWVSKEIASNGHRSNSNSSSEQMYTSLANNLSGLCRSSGDIFDGACAFNGNDTPWSSEEIASSANSGRSSSRMSKSEQMFTSPANSSSPYGNTPSTCLQDSQEASCTANNGPDPMEQDVSCNNNATSSASISPKPTSINNMARSSVTASPINTCTNNNAASKTASPEITCTNNNAASKTASPEITCTNNNAASSKKKAGNFNASSSAPSSRKATPTNNDPPSTTLTIDALHMDALKKASQQSFEDVFSKKLASHTALTTSLDRGLSCSVDAVSYSDMSLAEKIGQRKHPKKKGCGVSVPLPGGPKPNDILRCMMGMWTEQLTSSYLPPAVPVAPSKTVVQVTVTSKRRKFHVAGSIIISFSGSLKNGKPPTPMRREKSFITKKNANQSHNVAFTN